MTTERKCAVEKVGIRTQAWEERIDALCNAGATKLACAEEGDEEEGRKQLVRATVWNYGGSLHVMYERWLERNDFVDYHATMYVDESDVRRKVEDYLEGATPVGELVEFVSGLDDLRVGGPFPFSADSVVRGDGQTTTGLLGQLQDVRLQAFDKSYPDPKHATIAREAFAAGMADAIRCLAEMGVFKIVDEDGEVQAEAKKD